MPGGKAESHKAAFDASLAEKTVDRAKHFGGAMLLRAEAAQRADGDSAVESGGASLSGDVTDRDAQFLRTVTEKVVEVSAQFARADDASGDVEAVLGARQTREKRALNAAG